MKGLGANRSRHLSDSCDPSAGHQELMYPSSADPRSPYLLSPNMDHYGGLDASHHFPPPTPSSLTSDYLLPLNNQLSNSSTFPRIHYNPHFDTRQPDLTPGGGSIGGISTGTTLATSMSMGMAGRGTAGRSMITSGSATISAGSKMNRLPANLLDQFEKQLPIHRDGFSTLQFHRGAASKQRSDSPGRIRYLVNSVQKLFAKSQSLEGSAKGSVNGRFSNSSGSEDPKHNRRSKSKDRAKTESSKQRVSSNISGFWSSDDNLDGDASSYRHPTAPMTLGRCQTDNQGPSKYFMHAYNTISEHTLKTSKSSNDLKFQACPTLPGPGEGGGGGVEDSKHMKRGSWSTLTLSQAQQVCQKGSATIDRTRLKSKSCHQDLACQYLKVPAGLLNSTLSRDRAGGSSQIPCRRMRSGSYIKAMADEDSEDSEGSPKPSPKTAARRQSYLKATQQSLSEQLPPRNCLPSLREMSNNRSLDNLDCIGVPSGSTYQCWEDEDFSQASNTLGKNSCISQVQQLEVHSQYEEMCESVFSEMDSQAVQVLDLPLPTCFRSRSHSYLRAIQAGCSQDDDMTSISSESPPPISTVRTFSTSTSSTCITTYKKTPPPVPPRTTSKPFIAVTVQSSTESAQDIYLDNQDRKSEANSQSGLSNSSDSLNSTRANSLAKGRQATPPVATPREVPPHNNPALTAPRDTQYDTLKTDKGTVTTEEPRAELVPKRKLSSIGIQVDCIQQVQREELPPLTRFQSIGVQVEDSWQQSRSSSMTSKQETDSNMQNLSNCKSSDKGTGTSSQSVECSTQGSGDGEGGGKGKAGPTRQLSNCMGTRSSSSSFSESLDPALDPSSLPPPDPWLETGSSGAPSGPAQPGAPTCRRDGYWFLKLLQAEAERMEGWCQQMNQETKENQLSEEVLGKIRSAVGSAQLLISKKFQQFRGLCEQNMNANANPRPTAQDLAGFWDLLQLSIEDISMKFDELYHLKTNDWQLVESPDRKEGKKQPPPVPKKPSKPKPAASREKGDSSVDKQRQEARKRLMAAKRAASVRQNSATESADSIEIYVPEAQTRL
ncbi:disks large-associated protein 4-like isoform X2 [Polyodon spathula]|uniref:disks large-associated protein 4-like isoform X2 n=1 Tax=Polyodon spathula TaxID=7913 RepID=UPI001B7F5F01|nr:disks large-associated protein 4-like isoform X2 [Polyodon spathula]